jgi:hypothetical protein
VSGSCAPLVASRTPPAAPRQPAKVGAPSALAAREWLEGSAFAMPPQCKQRGGCLQGVQRLPQQNRSGTGGRAAQPWFLLESANFRQQRFPPSS